MSQHTEPLNGGLWTAPDPMMLEAGQLTSLQNARYRPGTQALYRVLGRTSFGAATATAAAVYGLRDVRFDNGTHTLVAAVSASLVTAAVGDTGTFGVLTGVTAGTSLEVAHFRNRFYLMNGATAGSELIGTNQVVYLSATAAGTPMSVRQHGMLPVNASPQTATAGGVFSQTVTGYYDYWTTEVAKFPQDGVEQIMESTFDSQSGPTTVFVSSTAVVPQIAMPAIRNPAVTTHWRIYRSPKKDKVADKIFPSGFMIADLATATASAGVFVADNQTTASASAFASNVTTIGLNGFTNATNLLADDGNYASGAVVFGTKSQAVYGFNMGGFSGTIKGIQVELQAYISVGTGPVPINVRIGRRNKGTDLFQRFGQLLPNEAARGATITATAPAGETVILGGSADRWFAPNAFAPIVDKDFSQDFMVALDVSKFSTTIGVDYIKTTVYYSSTFDSVTPFPTVVYTFGDIAVQVGKNGKPPSSSVGDVFEDSFVTNDRENPANICYSFPGDTDAFPAPYFVDFDTPENDRITMIRVVNDKLVVGLDTSLWRVDYLPSERDASFDRGKSKKVISRQVGVVNEMCACTFTMGDSTELLAFVSDIGIHATDGFNLIDMTYGLDWRGIIATAGATAIALINDPENRELRFTYRNSSYAEPDTDIRLSYSRSHVNGGQLKVSGRSTLRNFDSGSSTTASVESIYPVRRSGGETQVYIGYGGVGQATAAGAGFVYRENGNSIPSQDPTMSWQTRRMYLAGLGNEWRLNELHQYMGSYSGGPVLTYVAKNVKTDDVAGETTSGSKARTLGGQKMARFQFSQQAEGLRLAATASGQVAFSTEAIVMDVTNFDLEDSGK